MYYSVAVYPRKEGAACSSGWRDYMEAAATQGFSEVFMSLHLPEYTVSQQLTLLEQLSEAAHRLSMDITTDVGGSQLKELLASEDYSERIRRAGVAFIRLDYGFTEEQLRQIWERWGIRGFVINASTCNREGFVLLKETFRKIDERIELRACHNYYPRPETGLSYDFFVQQNAMLKELGIPVYGCIPDSTCPRGPVREGLPTVEAHRNMELSQVVSQLTAGQGCEGLMAADEYFSTDKLICIRETAEKQRRQGCVWTLRVCFEPGTPKEERKIICGQTHHIRYDSNEWVLRSQSSRQMAEYASRIAPRDAVVRRRGMVTIDNLNYGRYSGEVQIVLKDMPADERVNVAGWILEEDMWKLAHCRYGVDYRFEEAAEIRPMREEDTEEIVDLWNRNLPYCPITSQEWAGIVLADENRNPQLCLTAVEQGRVVGFAVGMVRKYPYLERGLEPGKAWILALAVDHDSRGKGIGTRLLASLEEKFHEKGCDQIVVAAYSPYYFTAGIHESEPEAMRLFEKHGYKRGEASYWMERTLTEYRLPEAIAAKKKQLEQEGFSFLSYTADYASRLLEFLEENFSTGWRMHVIRAMQQKRLEGHCILCCREGKAAGYVQRGIGGDEHRYGPFGVAPEYRNKGMGAVLLHLTWEAMRQDGLDYVYFRSTEENGRRFYERHGMQVKEIYYHYSKTERK